MQKALWSLRCYFYQYSIMTSQDRAWNADDVTQWRSASDNWVYAWLETQKQVLDEDRVWNIARTGRGDKKEFWNVRIKFEEKYEKNKQ